MVQVWKDFSMASYYSRWQEYARDLTKKKLQIIISGCWYLNIMNGGDDWKKYYECDPRSFEGEED